MLGSSLSQYDDDHAHSHGQAHGHGHGPGQGLGQEQQRKYLRNDSVAKTKTMCTNKNLVLLGISVCIINILMFLISEFDFVFIALNYSEKKCINHKILVFIGWINLCEVITSLYVFYNSKRIIQYLKESITALKTYGDHGMDVQNNLNPTKRMLKLVGILNLCFIIIDFLPSFWISGKGRLIDNQQCFDFWILNGFRFTFVVFRIIVCIIGLMLLVALFLICFINLIKRCIKCLNLKQCVKKKEQVDHIINETENETCLSSHRHETFENYEDYEDSEIR